MRLDAPAYDSARGGAATYLFPNSGGHRRAPTATSRLGLALRRSGASRRGKMCCLGLLLYCRELLGTVLDSVAEESRLGDESVEEAHFVDIAPLNKAEPLMVLLDHTCGHPLPEGLRCDFSRP